MTPVETLTAAVALYEQRREGVTEGPWHEGPEIEVKYGDFGWYVHGCPAGETDDTEQGRADARHIASWSPSATDPVVQAWRALLDRLTRWDAASTALGAVERAVLASATAYLAGAA